MGDVIRPWEFLRPSYLRWKRNNHRMQLEEQEAKRAARRAKRQQRQRLVTLLVRRYNLGAAPAPLSDADHALVLAVMSDHGWSYEEARKRLELSGM
jgi:hypothetical protein